MGGNFYLKFNKETIKLNAKPFAGGGEGDLYKISSPYKFKNYVAKIYHPHKLSDHRESKILFLINNPPVGLTGAVIWASDAIYDSKNKFAGFIMPFVKGKKLEILCLGKLPRKINSIWERFDLKNPQAFNYRLRICFNLAAAVYQIHATNKYVLVDLKPDNIIIQPEGLVSIVDTDSVEVVENGKLLFSAPVATPEYTPPEFYDNNFRENDIVDRSWDNFSLAVIFYKLLFGIHPFAASAKSPYDNLVSIHQKIEQGFFVHNKKIEHLLTVIPPPHSLFSKLSPELKRMFIECFADGQNSPQNRPHAEDWCSTLLPSIGDPELEAHFSFLSGFYHKVDLTKFIFPSALLKDSEINMVPNAWIEKKVNDFLGTVPDLPTSLKSLPSNAIKNFSLSIDMKDYVFSWAFTGSLITAFLLLIPGLLNWLIYDFWSSSFFLINFLILAVFLLPQFILPRLSSFVRHFFSEQYRLTQLWNRFSVSYPELRADLEKKKQSLISRLKNENNEVIAGLKKNRTGYVSELKAFLKNKDQEVIVLKKALIAEVEKLNKKLVNKAFENSLFLQFNAPNLTKLEMDLQKHIKINSLKENDLIKEFELLDELKKEKTLAVTELEGHYDIKYQTVFDECTTEINKISGLVKNLDKKYKIPVENLLISPDSNKMKISISGQLKKTKKDILSLSKLSVD